VGLSSECDGGVQECDGGGLDRGVLRTGRGRNCQVSVTGECGSVTGADWTGGFYVGWSVGWRRVTGI
jgi:hypothetical protein